MAKFGNLAAVLVLLSVACGATELCPASRGTSVTLSVASLRNATGHWVVSVNLANQGLRKNPAREISLDVEQSTASCQDVDSHQLVVVTTVARKTPPGDYEVVNGLGYYKLHTAALSWEEARDMCEQEGAHLLVINSEKEASVVKEFFAQGPKIQNATREYGVYVGIHDRYAEGQYISVLGEPLDSLGYKNFATGEPNGGTRENCMAAARSAKYFDIPCTTWRLAFICEQ